MFKRFTEQSRQALKNAQEEASVLGHPFLGTEHILLGLIRDHESVGGKVLTSLGVSVDEVRAATIERLGPCAPLDEGRPIEVDALATIGIDFEAVKESVEETFGEGALDRTAASRKAAATATPFTPRAKKVLELALREARKLDHSYIGTEHLVLGLVRERKGVAFDILTERGLTPDGVRAAVVAELRQAS